MTQWFSLDCYSVRTNFLLCAPSSNLDSLLRPSSPLSSPKSISAIERRVSRNVIKCVSTCLSDPKYHKFVVQVTRWLTNFSVVPQWPSDPTPYQGFLICFKSKTKAILWSNLQLLTQMECKTSIYGVPPIQQHKTTLNAFTPCKNRINVWFLPGNKLSSHMDAAWKFSWQYSEWE